MSTALTRQQTQAIADRPKQISVALREFQDESKYILLGPKTHLGSIPGGTSLSVREVKVDAKDKAQAYHVGQGKVALAGTVLDKVCAAAGASTILSERTDDRKHPHYWEHTVRLRVTDLDGSIREEVGTKTLDLRADAGGGIPGKDYQAMVDAAKRAKPPRDPDQQISEARKFGAEICASKAKNRATAHLLSIARAYLPKDLAKPFIIPKLVPDGEHPVSQQAILANMMGSANALYGAIGAAVATDNGGQVVDAEFEDASETAASPAAAAMVPDGDGDEPPHDPKTGEETGTKRVVEMITAAWQTAKAGGIDAATFRKICQTQTGCESKEQMTETHAQSVIDAVSAYIANSDDGVPV